MRSSPAWPIAVIGITLGLTTPMNAAATESSSFKQLSVEWWQWALSVPVDASPLLDETGANCMVGQRGPIWFLAGNFGGGTTARSCSIPEGTSLFFPIVNSVGFNTPDVCGQGPENIPFDVWRDAVVAFIDGTTNVSASLDGCPVRFRRAQSDAFAIALPEDNVFNDACIANDLGPVPPTIYSPAASDGFYAKLRPLSVGEHTLTFHAENPDADFLLDVTYDLTVVPVSLE